MSHLAPKIDTRQLAPFAKIKFRRLDLASPKNIADLNALLRPFAPLAIEPDCPITSFAFPTTATETPPTGLWRAITLAAEGDAPFALTCLVPQTLIDALDINSVPGAAAIALQLEIALEVVMTAIDTACGVRMELLPEDETIHRAHWRRLDVTLADGSDQHIWIGADRDALPKLARLTASLATATPPCLAHLPIAVHIGQTELSRDEFTALRPGDTILPAPNTLSFDTGQLVLNGQSVALVNLSEGTVTLKKDPEMTLENTQTNAHALDALPVQLDFLLPGKAMDVDAIRNLSAGSVVPLEMDVDTPMVDLCVSGRSIGRGEIVEVGGRLAIHIHSVGA